MSVLRDTWIVFGRQLRLSLRNPTWVLLMLSQPLLYLFLFGPLLKPITASIAQGHNVNAYQVFIPGLIVQLGMFGAMFVGFALIAEWRAGVIEADRVTPASRVALLAGRVLRDVLVLLFQSLALIGLSYPMGLRAPVGGVLLALLNGLAMPLLLLSGILLPMSLGPKWLQRLSDVSPLKHIVEGVRALFRGEVDSSASLWGLFWVVLLTILGLWAGARTFRKESA